MTQLTLPGEGPVKDYHDFQEQLEYSAININVLEPVYRHAFPAIKSIERVTDLGLQRQGIDTKVTLNSGRVLYFDEKRRRKDYGDFLLEEYSVFERKIEGWLSGQKQTDYITYIITANARAYFLPFLLLQQAWEANRADWIENIGRRFAQNINYRTSFVCVPRDVVFQAMFRIKTPATSHVVQSQFFDVPMLPHVPIQK